MGDIIGGDRIADIEQGDVKIKTIKQIHDEFLEEQKTGSRLETYDECEDVISLFEDYLDGYAYQYLDEEDSRTFEELPAEDEREFCEVFGADQIDYCTMREFLGYFMVKKVMAGKTFKKTVVRVMQALVNWMHDKGYMDEEEHADTIEGVKETGAQLPKVEEVADLITDYAVENPVARVIETLEDRFTVTRIGPGKLWFERYLSTSNEEVGPVPVSSEISSKCERGWKVWLTLGRTDEGWHIMESGFIYPR